jgi:hypothetical protein
MGRERIQVQATTAVLMRSWVKKNITDELLGTCAGKKRRRMFPLRIKQQNIAFTRDNICEYMPS